MSYKRVMYETIEGWEDEEDVISYRMTLKNNRKSKVKEEKLDGILWITDFWRGYMSQSGLCCHVRTSSCLSTAIIPRNFWWERTQLRDIVLNRICHQFCMGIINCSRFNSRAEKNIFFPAWERMVQSPVGVVPCSSELVCGEWTPCVRFV
jgi:hypothetical protein